MKEKANRYFIVIDRSISEIQKERKRKRCKYKCKIIDIINEQKKVYAIMEMIQHCDSRCPAGIRILSRLKENIDSNNNRIKYLQSWDIIRIQQLKQSLVGRNKVIVDLSEEERIAVI